MKKIQKIFGLIIIGILVGMVFSTFSPAVQSQTGINVTITLSAGDHTVAIGAIVFTRHSEEGLVQMDHMAFDDPFYKDFKCEPGETKKKTFTVPKVPNNLEIIYISDGGSQTPYTIPVERFRFGKWYTLPSPSPGTDQEPPPEDPPGDALIRVTIVMPIVPLTTPNYINQMHPVSDNHIREAEDYIIPLENMIEEAKERGEDTSKAEEKLEEAKKELEKAKEAARNRNYIAANNHAMKAIKLFEECADLLNIPKEDDLDGAIERLEREYNLDYLTVRGLIEQAEADGKDVREAADYVKKAQAAIEKFNKYRNTNKKLAYLWLYKAHYYLFKAMESVPDCD